jgi:hypothetical protein
MSKKIKGWYGFPTVEVDGLRRGDRVLAIPSKNHLDIKSGENFEDKVLDISLHGYYDVGVVTKHKITLINDGDFVKYCCTGAWSYETYTKKELRNKWCFIRLNVDDTELSEIFMKVTHDSEISNEDKITTLNTLKKIYKEVINEHPHFAYYINTEEMINKQYGE